jgi:hypothetical protein
VAEVEADRVGPRRDQEALLEPAQPVVDLPGIELADVGEQVELEGAADHGGGVGDRLRRPVQRPRPGQDRVGQGVGDRDGRDAPRARLGRGVAGGGQELLDMQRDASLRSCTASTTLAGAAWPSSTPVRAAVWSRVSRGGGPPRPGAG